MTQTNPSITKFQITGQISPSILTQWSEAIQVLSPFNFQNITVLNVETGTYTPANDTKTIYTFGESEAPNFLLITVDQPSVLQLNHSASGAVIDNLPFSKTFVLAIPDLVSGDWTTVVLNGSSAGISPMQQGVAMNYTIVACTAQVS